jgi:hypothetical protein
LKKIKEGSEQKYLEKQSIEKLFNTIRLIYFPSIL